MEIILAIVVALILASIIFYFARSVIVFIIVCLVSFLLFNIIFVWNGDEVVEKLRLDEVLSEDNSETLKKWLNNFDSKREEHSVIDTEAISNNVKDKAIEAKDGVVKKYNETDKEKVINELKELFKGLNDKEIDNIIQENEDLLEKYNITKDELVE